jgi:hypothetical protein
MTAAYTAFLFGQAKGRVLWMKRGYWLQLLAQALVAGSGLLLVLLPVLGWSTGSASRLEWLLAIGLGTSLAFAFLEERLAPRGREREYQRAARLVTKGPYAAMHTGMCIGAGVVLPLALLAIQIATGGVLLGALAGALALVGLWFTEDVFVRAGQSLPIS